MLFAAFEPGRSRSVYHEILTDLIGFALAALGQAIHIATLGTAWIRRGGHNSKIHADRLITSGWYAHCRNPIYIGNFLVVIGLLIMFNNFIVFVVALAAIVFSYHAIVITEENYLIRHFGIEYQFVLPTRAALVANFQGSAHDRTLHIDPLAVGYRESLYECLQLDYYDGLDFDL